MHFLVSRMVVHAMQSPIKHMLLMYKNITNKVNKLLLVPPVLIDVTRNDKSKMAAAKR